MSRPDRADPGGSVERGGARRPTFALWCVLDDQPRFYVEVVLWAMCVRRHLPDNFRPGVHLVGSPPADLVSWLITMGIALDAGPPVVPGSPHSNKIAPFAARHETDFVIVCDSDLFFVRDPTELFTSARFRAAPNNHCNPPPPVFEAVLEAAGLGSYRPGVSLFAGADSVRETHINNISAGIVAAPTDRAAKLAQVWRRWAHWLVERRELLGAWAVHVDQVAFALSMEELGEDVELLPPQVNAVLELLDKIHTCYAFHLTTGHLPAHAERFRADRTLAVDGLQAGVRSSVHRLNGAIAEAITVLNELPSTRGHIEKFMNPAWIR